MSRRPRSLRQGTPVVIPVRPRWAWALLIAGAAFVVYLMVKALIALIPLLVLALLAFAGYRLWRSCERQAGK